MTTTQQTTEAMRETLESQNGKLADFGFNKHTRRFEAWTFKEVQAYAIYIDVLRAGCKAEMIKPDGGPFCTGHYRVRFGAK